MQTEKPLTPALSPSEGERENRRQPVGDSDAVEIAVRRAPLFPLPIGWGICLARVGGRSVAQISNLLYRRIPFVRPSDNSATQEVSKSCGLEIRDTADWKSALR